MFDRILVAVDGSDPARQAADAGLVLAKRTDATVDVVNVRDGDDESERWGREAVAEVADAADLDVETHVLEGRPHEAIVDHAVDTGASLLVMGRHGRTGLGERLLGTVTDRVLRDTPVPVLTVPGGVDHEYDDLLATTDGSENAELAVPYGVGLARAVGANLHVLRAVDVQAEAGVFDAGGVTKEYVERLEQQGREDVERFLQGVDATDVAVETAVVRGVAHRVVREYVADESVDLVVMASKGTSSLGGRYLGSVADRVLRVVDVPVLIVPE